MDFDVDILKDREKFRYRSSGIIVEDGMVLVAGNERDDYYYSVGGGVHLGETSEEAALREVFEETGEVFEIASLGFIHENFFNMEYKGETYSFHELSFYYVMKKRGTKELSRPSGNNGGVREFVKWIPIEELEKYNIYPSNLKEFLEDWEKGNKHIRHYITDRRV